MACSPTTATSSLTSAPEPPTVRRLEAIEPTTQRPRLDSHGQRPFRFWQGLPPVQPSVSCNRRMEFASSARSACASTGSRPTRALPCRNPTSRDVSPTPPSGFNNGVDFKGVPRLPAGEAGLVVEEGCVACPDSLDLAEDHPESPTACSPRTSQTPCCQTD